jgi:hypothetical protein
MTRQNGMAGVMPIMVWILAANRPSGYRSWRGTAKESHFFLQRTGVHAEGGALGLRPAGAARTTGCLGGIDRSRPLAPAVISARIHGPAVAGRRRKARRIEFKVVGGGCRRIGGDSPEPAAGPLRDRQAQRWEFPSWKGPPRDIGSGPPSRSMRSCWHPRVSLWAKR